MSIRRKTSNLLERWQPLLAGVDCTCGAARFAFALPNHPREQNVTAIRVDLTHPAIQFFTTPRAGRLDTLGERLVDFVARCPNAVAINANFCWPDFKGYKVERGLDGGYSTRGMPYKLFGLAMSEGQLVSSLDTVPDLNRPGTTALMISKDNRAQIGRVTRDAHPPPDTWTAVAGGPQPGRPDGPRFEPAFEPTSTVGGPAILVEDGENMAEPALIPAEAVAARTAVGLSEDGKTMFWLTVDDLDDYNPDDPAFDPAKPQVGAAFYDIGEWLLMAGAHRGMTLDGGKSTAMAYSRPDGTPQIMNCPRPDGGETTLEERLRCVGNFLGVQSAPLRAG